MDRVLARWRIVGLAIVSVLSFAACDSIVGPDLDGRYDLVEAGGHPLPWHVELSGLCSSLIAGATWKHGWLLVENGNSFRIEWTITVAGWSVGSWMQGTVRDLGGDVWLFTPQATNRVAYTNWGSFEARVGNSEVRTNLWRTQVPEQNAVACLTFRR